MKLEKTDVWGFEHALRGMRNPLASWDRSDSTFSPGSCKIGKNDLSLAMRLIRSGTEHRKFLRQIMVSVDITAPLYWWKEFDTYKIGTTANSTSTMHKIAAAPITVDCFETDDCDFGICGGQIEKITEFLEELRIKYLETKDKRYWKELIRWLPEAWLQTRTVTMNYENLINMYFQRRSHKLTEWHTFCDWIRTLPYSELITEEPDKNQKGDNSQ